MLLHKTDKLQIYFGDAADGVFKHLHCNSSNTKLVEIDPFNGIAKKINVSRLSLLNQTHGTQGVRIMDQDISFTTDGDYLITDQKNIGIGVLTADCVPLVLHDIKKQAIAIVHAGWRGAVAEIVPKTIKHMQRVWGTCTDDLQLYFGPSAHVCCYQVQSDFSLQVDPLFCDQVMLTKNNNWYFDTVKLVQLQISAMGVSEKTIHKDFNFCTMCDARFFSHRRLANTGRQITIARLY